MNESVVNVGAWFLASDAAAEAFRCDVVAEDALTLIVDEIGHYTLMWTPTGDPAIAQAFTVEDGLLGDGERPEGLCLALGFALSEGLIDSLDDIRSLSACRDQPGVVRLVLREPAAAHVGRRNVVINSSCGICGPREILEDNALGLGELPQSLLISPAQLSGLMTQMQDAQVVFHRTGGSHAAALFSPEGDILAVAEDLGRHNALDKVIGMALLARGSVAGCGVVLSSRISLELVLKALRAGLEIMLAVSAPTSLAIDVAQRYGLTVAGFVRDGRATLYSHPQRIRPQPPDP